MQAGKNIYFASDFHLGVDGVTTSRERERQLVTWLDSIAPQAEAIFLVGDLFDFWFEYRQVVPRGYVRLLGKLAELADQGIAIHIFSGNHDVWMFGYFEEELGIPVYHQPIVREFQGRTFFIGHGDGLGPNDRGYKMLKRIFRNPACQWLFSRLHPNFGSGLANYFSGRSRSVNPSPPEFLGPEGEWLIAYSNRKLEQIPADYFIFGHRHLPIDYTLKNGRSRYINLGEWLNFRSYAVFDGQDLEVRFFENPSGQIYGQ